MIHDVEIRTSPGRGHGVFALREFSESELIFRRRHVPVADVAAVADLDRPHVCQTGITSWALVAPPGRYLNHSCEPNALRRGVNVLAWRDIDVGEEVTLDYRLNATGLSAWRCLCGAPTCSGLVEGGFFGLPEERQLQLLRFAGDFVRAEYRRRHGSRRSKCRFC